MSARILIDEHILVFNRKIVNSIKNKGFFMKIGVDIRVLMDKYYSGISEYTANLLSAMLEQDKTDEFKLFYNSYHGLDGRLDRWNKGNAKVIGSHWPNKVFNYLLQKTFCYPRLDQFLGGTDVFWSPHFNFTSLSAGTKKIITVHDLSFLRYPQFFSGRKNLWHKALGVKKALKEADLIIAVSENTKNDIIGLAGVRTDKVKVIYSGNNVARKEWPEAEINDCLQKFGISGRFVLYVGNIEPRKNIAGLIEAYDRLREKTDGVSLVLAGAPGWKNKKIYDRWRQSPHQADIKFIGYINEAEKETLYSKASVFAYPSFYEGFGFPPLEAMTYGVPVVCSNVSSLPEIVGEAGLMVNPDKPEEIAEAMEMALNDDELRSRLITAGPERARNFSWDKAAHEYLDSFKEIYEGKR